MWKRKTLFHRGDTNLLSDLGEWELFLKIISNNDVIHSNQFRKSKFRNLFWVTDNKLFKIHFFFISNAFQMMDIMIFEQSSGSGIHYSISQISWKHFIDFLYISKIILWLRISFFLNWNFNLRVTAVSSKVTKSKVATNRTRYSHLDLKLHLSS